MHNIQPNEPVRVIQIEIAVPASMSIGQVSDNVADLLARAVESFDGWLLDWRYTGHQRYVTAPAKPEQGAIFGLPGDELGAVLDWSAAAGCTTAVADLLAYFRQFAEIAAKKLLPPHLGRPDELVDVLLVQALRASGHAQLATEVEAGLWRRPDPLPAGVSHV